MQTKTTKGITVTSRKEAVVDASLIPSQMDILHISATVHDLFSPQGYSYVTVKLQGLTIHCSYSNGIYFMDKPYEDTSFTSPSLFGLLNLLEITIAENQNRIKTQSLVDELGF